MVEIGRTDVPLSGWGEPQGGGKEVPAGTPNSGKEDRSLTKGRVKENSLTGKRGGGGKES